MIRLLPRLLAAACLIVAFAGPPAASVAAGGGCHGQEGTPHSEGPSTVVKMELCAFVPTVVHVSQGETVRFLNSAPVEHLVVGESRTWGTDDTIQPGGEISHRFDLAGVYPYSCPLHPGMVGAVVVEPVAASTPGSDAAAPVPPVNPPAGAGVSGPPTADSAWQPIAAVALLAIIVVGVVLGLFAWWRRSGDPVPARHP